MAGIAASGLERQRPVIVAVVAMHVMQPAVHQAIHVVAMRHALMAAIGAVLVGRAASPLAGYRVGGADFDHMLVHVPVVEVVQVPIVEIIHVAVMHHCRVPATGAMLVGMILVNFALAGHVVSFHYAAVAIARQQPER